jgi:hypothetical protein
MCCEWTAVSCRLLVMALLRQMAPPTMGPETLEAVRKHLPSSLWIGLPTDGLTPPLRPETDDAEANELSRELNKRNTLGSTWQKERDLAIGLSARRAIDEAKVLRRQRLDGLREAAGNNVARIHTEITDAHAQVRLHEEARGVYKKSSNGGVDIAANVGAVVVVGPQVQGDLDVVSETDTLQEQMRNVLAELASLEEEYNEHCDNGASSTGVIVGASQESKSPHNVVSSSVAGLGSHIPGLTNGADEASNIMAMQTWKTIEVRGDDFHRCVVIKVDNSCCQWEIAPFHEYVRSTDLCRWLDPRGVHNGIGAARVAHFGKQLYPRLDCLWWEPCRTAVQKKRKAELDNADKTIVSFANGLAGESVFSYSSNAIWLIAYLLLPGCMQKTGPSIRRNAYNMLDLLVAKASSNAEIEVCSEYATFKIDRGRCWKSWFQTDLPSECALQEILNEENQRVGENVVSLTTGAGVLWLWTRLAHRLHKGSFPDCVRLVDVEALKSSASALLQSMIASVARSLDEWAIREKEPSTHTLLSMQVAGRRSGPLLLARLAHKIRPRACARQWREDGCDKAFAPNVANATSRQCGRYANATCELMSKEPLVELVFDASRFGGRDTEVFIIYAPMSDVAAYLPPQVLRELGWRQGAAGSTMSDADIDQFGKTGFKNRPRMKTVDMLRTLNHILSVGLKRDLEAFRPPCEISLMQAGTIRYWNRSQGRWYRANEHEIRAAASRSNDAEAVGVPELADNYLQIASAIGHEELRIAFEMAAIKVLLLDVDQAQTQWSACHFLADKEGLGIFVMFRGDLFHRSWNDFKRAVRRAKGTLMHTILQLSQVYTVNYGPFMNGGNMSSRREQQSEWAQLFPEAGPEFESLAQEMAIDGRIPKPSSHADLQKLYETLVLDDKNYRNKGEYTKQAAWYSIMAGMHKNDSIFHASRFHSAALAKYMLGDAPGKDKFSRVVRDVANLQASVISAADDSVADHKKQMRDVARRAGNMLLLSPALMHNVNLFNSRVLLLAASPSWTEQTMWSLWKTAPNGDRRNTIQLASGAGEDMLRQMWRGVTSDPRELARLGWQVVDGLPATDVSPSTGLGGGCIAAGVPSADIPGRLMSFLLHFMEQRFWAYAWYEWALPEGFASGLSHCPRAAQCGLDRIRRLWEASTDVESAAQEFPSAATLRAEVYWLSWPICQWLLRTLAHFNFRSHAAWEALFTALFTRIGDTKGVEETRRIGRAEEKRGQQPDVVALASFFRRLAIENTPLQHRGVQHLTVSDNELYDSTSTNQVPHKPWPVMFGHPNRRIALPRGLGCHKIVEGGARFTTKTPDSGRVSIAAARALVYLHQTGQLQTAGLAWQSIALTPHGLFHDGSTVYLVVAGETYAARAWPAHVEHQDHAVDGWKKRYLFDLQDSWAWVVAVDIKKWFSLPADWVLNRHDTNRFGFVAAEVVSEPIPAVIPALLLKSYRRIPDARRQDFLEIYDEPFKECGRDEAEIRLFRKVLDGRADCARHVAELEAIHAAMAAIRKAKQLRKKQKEADECGDSSVNHASEAEEEEVDEIQGALSFAALEDMGEANRKEFTGIRKQLGGNKPVRTKAQQLRRDARKAGKLAGDGGERMGRDASEAKPKEQDNAPTASKHSEENTSVCRPPKRAQTNMFWARPYVPGMPESGAELPANVKRSSLEYPPGDRFVWVARYVGLADDLFTEGLKRPTRTRSHGEKLRTEHQAFQLVLKWLWQKHACAILPLEQALPERVRMAMSECGECNGGGDCRYMDNARASVPNGAVEDLPSSAEDSLAGGGDSETVSDASNAPPSTMAALNSKAKAKSRVSGKQRLRLKAKQEKRLRVNARLWLNQWT